MDDGLSPSGRELGIPRPFVCAHRHKHGAPHSLFLPGIRRGGSKRFGRCCGGRGRRLSRRDSTPRIPAAPYARIFVAGRHEGVGGGLARTSFRINWFRHWCPRVSMPPERRGLRRSGYAARTAHPLLRPTTASPANPLQICRSPNLIKMANTSPSFGCTRFGLRGGSLETPFYPPSPKIDLQIAARPRPEHIHLRQPCRALHHRTLIQFIPRNRGCLNGNCLDGSRLPWRGSRY